MPAKLPPPGDERTLYVLDLSGYVFRAYHGLPPLSNSKGEPTHATFGVANMLNALVRDRRPRYLAIAMDSRGDSLRKEIYPEYKAHRPPPPPDLSLQMVRCREIAEAYAIPILQQDRYEADDLIAACVREARKHGLVTVVCTADKDLMQLVADDVVLWDSMRNRVSGAEEVREKWSVGPERVRDLLALMGDTSDNVPGVPGVGEKTAAKLIHEHGSLDGVYQHLDAIKGKLKENLTKHESDARLSYRLVGLVDTLPVELDLAKLEYGGWDPTRLRALFHELEFHRLAAAVEGVPVAATPAVSASVSPATTARKDSLITTSADLAHVVDTCRAARVVTIDVVATSPEPMRADAIGVAIAWDPANAAYVPFGHRTIGDPAQLPRAEVVAALAPLMADANVEKLGHDVKLQDVLLRRFGAPAHEFAFDSMLASYVLDPERHDHQLEEVARAEINLDLSAGSPPAKSRGKTPAASADQIDVITASRRVLPAVRAVQQLWRPMRERLENAQLWDLLANVELPLARVLGRMEEFGVLVDVEHLRVLSADAGREMQRLEQELIAIVGHEWNVNSPRQLETILFDELKLPVIKRTKTSRSTDHEVLEELAEQHPLPAKCLEHRSLLKLKGTYLDALPELVHPSTGRIHTSYLQAVAATGRISSNNPNLQNIPIRTEFGRRIREAFIVPPGHGLLSADYSQIELRVLAHLSRDPILVDAFQKNEDIHTRTAMEIFGVAREQVTKEMRGRAKTTNFAVLYGQGEAALSRQLGIARAEAGRFIEQYFAAFPSLTKFLDDTVVAARAGDSVRTLLGRRRFMRDIQSENRGLRAQAERIAKNTPIQGSAADLMKLAMVEVDRRLSAERSAARMILTVHDELVFEVPDAERTRVEQIVRETMEGVMKLRVPLVVDTGWGPNWARAH